QVRNILPANCTSNIITCAYVVSSARPGGFQDMEDRKVNVGRREFAKVAVGAAAALSSTRISRATVHPNPPGIKIATSARADPTDEDLLFLQQVGVEYVSLPASPTSNAESFTKMRERYES